MAIAISEFLDLILSAIAKLVSHITCFTANSEARHKEIPTPYRADNTLQIKVFKKIKLEFIGYSYSKKII